MPNSRVYVAKGTTCGPPFPYDPDPAPSHFAHAFRQSARGVVAGARTGRALRAPACGSPGQRRRGDAAAASASLPRPCRQRWLGAARPRSRRGLILFAAAAFDVSGLGPGRRSHADGLRLCDRCRPAGSDRSDRSGAGGSDTRAGRSPRRQRNRRSKHADRARAAHWSARSPDRACGGPCRIERAPPAAAPRQYSRHVGRCGDGAADRGKRASRRGRRRLHRCRGPRRRLGCRGARDRCMRHADHHGRQRRRRQRCGHRGLVAGVARSSSTASRCSPAGPRPSAGSERSR